MKDPRIRARAIYFLYGALSLLAQVILTRRLLSVFSGNELIIGVLFSGWMFWTGIGGMIFSKPSDQSSRPGLGLALVLFLCALLFLLSSSCTWFLRFIFKFESGALPGLGVMIIAGFLISGPACLLLGAGFNYSARLFESDERNLVRLYLWEALGSAVGGMVFTLLLAGRISSFAQTLLCSLLITLCASLALETNKRYIIMALGIIIFGLALMGSGRIEKTLRLVRWRGQEVLEERESKYATITITKAQSQINFWLDGLPAFSYPNPELFEQTIQIPLSMCPKPEKVLLIGGGLLPAGEEIFKHPVKELVYLQIDPVLTELESKYLPGYKSLAWAQKLRVLHQDGRIFLSQTQEQFDAIILNLPDPETASLNRYYTKEFFQLAKFRLNPEGIFGFGIGSSGNYLSDGEASLLANALKSLDLVFPHRALSPLARNYLVASETGFWLTEDPLMIISRLKSRGVETKFVREYYLRDNLSAERVSAIKESAQRFFHQPPNTDLCPRGYYLSALLWLEQASPGFRNYVKRVLELEKTHLLFFLMGYFLLGLIWAWFRGARALALVSIFSIGFVGLSAELILMLGFQVAYGYVYDLLGILVSGFMGGLALGAYFYQRFKSWFLLKPISGLVLVVLGEFLSLLVCLLVLRILIQHPLGGFLTICAILGLLIIVAFFSGLCFPLSALVFMKERGYGIGSTAGWINAWDHFGSSLGALLSSLLLIPLFGLEFGLWFCALLLLAGLLSGLALARSR